MTHFNPMKGSKFGEPEIPPSQDLDDYDPTVYQVQWKNFRLSEIGSFLLFQGHSYGNFKGAAGLKLQFYGNEKTMNLNPLILANVQGSPYFKVFI